MERLLFIAGIPGCSKSTFGDWLEANRSFTHIDMETEDLDQFGLRDQWAAFWQGRNLDAFITSLGQISPKILLDWGFPPSLLGVVSNLKTHGADLWWFDGDRLWARVLFEKAKGAEALSTFDCQYARIAAEWASIARLFNSHIIRTVQPDGKVMQGEEIWSKIEGKYECLLVVAQVAQRRSLSHGF
jgi:hypothetical protein